MVRFPRATDLGASMLTVYSADHSAHHPRFEMSDGTLMAAVEIPRRAEIVREAVAAAGLGPIVAPEPFGTAPVARVHAADYLDFLANVWERCEAAGRSGEMFPLAWPVPGLRRIRPNDIDGLLGYYSFDAGTPLTSGTWTAARTSADIAVTAADRLVAGARSAFALCRPPGHHAGRDLYGGYCFLNNAAIAAEHLRANGAERVAILDIDYHHCNGTQVIFEARADVFVASLHADPRDEYPYFSGHADEVGVGDGEGYTANYPLPLGTRVEAWMAALDHALSRIAAYAPDSLVVSLGLDTFERDPISKFRLKSADYPAIGARLAGLGRPCLFVMEGGYAIEELGTNTVGVLTGFCSAERGS